ncbi:metal-dependent hydrolase [Halobacteria archaeon AArc-dxtr1]|nr:metal-dependent hydrolase [Halobacteria archaeon AArc-dxtr1]
MYQQGHYGAALLAYAPVGVAVGMAGFETAALLGAMACVSVSTLPDVDHRLPFVAHRGPTHSLAFVLLVAVSFAAGMAAIGDVTGAAVGSERVGFAFVVGAIGVGSHLLADAVTPMGIRPLWPVSDRHYTADLVAAKNPLANYALLGLGLAVTAVGTVIVAATG